MVSKMGTTALPSHADIKNPTQAAQRSLADMWDFLALEERVAWATEYQLVGVTVKSDDEGWLLVLKLARNGRYYVHFTGGRHFRDAIEAVLWEVDHGKISPRPDQYAR